MGAAGDVCAVAWSDSVHRPARRVTSVTLDLPSTLRGPQSRSQSAAGSNHRAAAQGLAHTPGANTTAAPRRIPESLDHGHPTLRRTRGDRSVGRAGLSWHCPARKTHNRQRDRTILLSALKKSMFRSPSGGELPGSIKRSSNNSGAPASMEDAGALEQAYSFRRGAGTGPYVLLSLRTAPTRLSCIQELAWQ